MVSQEEPAGYAEEEAVDEVVGADTESEGVVELSESVVLVFEVVTRTLVLDATIACNCADG